MQAEAGDPARGRACRDHGIGGPGRGRDDVERNAEHKYAVEWPEKPFVTDDTDIGGGLRMHSVQSAPGGIAAPVHYSITVYAHPPTMPGVPPPASADEWVSRSLETVAAKETGRKAVAIGPQRRPGVEVRTAEPGGGSSAYKRTVFALHAGRAYRLEAYSADPRRLDLAEADRFFASFELLD